MLILLIVVGILFVGSGSVYIYLRYQTKVFEEMPVIDERELDQYRLLLNDNLTGAVDQWNDNTWDKYNELNEKYGSVVHTHFKPTTVKRTNVEPQVSDYIKSLRLLNYEREWTGANGTTISLPRTPFEPQVFVNHKAKDIIARDNEEMRRIGVEPKPPKEIRMFANAYFDNDNSKQIIVEYGSLPHGYRAVAYFTTQEYDNITNEKFKDRFGADKPIYPKTIHNDKNY